MDDDEEVETDDTESDDEEKAEETDDTESEEGDSGEESNDADESGETEELGDGEDSEVVLDDEESEDDDDDLEEDEEEEEPEEDVDLDGETEDEDDDDGESKIFDQLNKEEDVKKAVELIRSRIADAEQTFIKNNAEDKKKVDELLDKISNNVKTIEDLNDKDSNEAKVAEESVRYEKRKIDAIRDNRTLTVFESMTRRLSTSILKSDAKDSYLTESGALDTDLVVEAAKVMYGFLETVNTLNLANVNAEYIKNILDKM